MRRGFVIIFLLVQTAVPAYQLMGPRPSRFGWQMYGGARAPSKATIVGNDGTESTENVAQQVGFYRSDLDVTEHLPAYLCRKHPEARAVRLNYILSDNVEYPCR